MPQARQGVLTGTESSPTLNAEGHRIALDCKGRTAFVSHAHHDHAGALTDTKTILADKATMRLLDARGIKHNAKHCEEFKSDALKIKLLNAGHVLGSTQLHAQWDGTSFAYTADFKTEDSLVTKKAEIPNCETLLIETTYGHPSYSFPKREEVYKKIEAWTKSQLANNRIAILGGYSLGKAQEIIKVLNEYCDIAPIVNASIANVCQVYNKHGAKLDFVQADTPQAREMLSDSFTAVLPPHMTSNALAHKLSNQYKRQVSIALATGWAAGGKRLFSADELFVLSDHCDFKQLLYYVEQSQAKKVLCTHGFAKEFAQELQKQGKQAIALEDYLKDGTMQSTLANTMQ